MLEMAAVTAGMAAPMAVAVLADILEKVEIAGSLERHVAVRLAAEVQTHPAEPVAAAVAVLASLVRVVLVATPQATHAAAATKADMLALAVQTAATEVLVAERAEYTAAVAVARRTTHAPTKTRLEVETVRFGSSTLAQV